MAGETKAVPTAFAKPKVKLSSAALTGQVFSNLVATTEQELADVVNLGYIPAGVTVLGFFIATPDMDSSTGIVFKVTVGSTDVLTGVTTAVLGSVATQAPSVRAIIPYATTENTLVSVTFTTAASGTASAGTIYITPIYFAT